MGIKLASGGRRSRRNQHQLSSEINITPMVDVMLVLLVIFMVTSPMLVAGVKVDLPETSSSPATGDDEPLAITVDKNGTVYIMDNVVPIDELTAKLKAITREKMDTRIFIRGDKNINYGKVIEVMGAINAAGFTKVALVTGITPTSPAKSGGN
jgi:biopolymer transport protein TolR